MNGYKIYRTLRDAGRLRKQGGRNGDSVRKNGDGTVTGWSRSRNKNVIFAITVRWKKNYYGEFKRNIRSGRII